MYKYNLILYIIAEALRWCCHVREKCHLKNWHVYNFKLKVPHGAFGKNEKKNNDSLC